MSAELIVICGVNEMRPEACQALADTVGDAFTKVATRALRVTKLVAGKATRAAATDAIREAVKVLSRPQGRVVIYYNGHGDQMRDASGDEADGRDEFWRMRRGALIDDEITRVISSSPCYANSLLTLISDSCSSGSMVDAHQASKTLRWVSIGACTDRQSAFASSEGGVMTCFGLIPTLEELSRNGKSCTASDLIYGIRKRIDIDSQKLTVDASNLAHDVTRSPIL